MRSFSLINRLEFGLRPSPAILGTVIFLHLEKYQADYPQTLNLIGHSLNVDPLMSGGVNVQEAFEIYKVSKHIMYHGGFNLRKWISKTLVLLQLINNLNIHLPHPLGGKLTQLQ